MTDRVRTLTVVLREDTRDDDAGAICDAIRMLAPVETVVLGPIVGGSDYMARETAKLELQRELRALLTPEFGRRRGGR